MTDESEPMRIVKLGDTRFCVEPREPDGYVLLSSDGTATIASFTRDEARQFAQDMLRWIRETDVND